MMGAAQIQESNTMSDEKYPDDAPFVIRTKGHPASMSYRRVAKRLRRDGVARFCKDDQWWYVFAQSEAAIERDKEAIKDVATHFEIVIWDGEQQ